MIAYQAVRACETTLDSLELQARTAALKRERDTAASLRISLIDRMLEEAATTVRAERTR